MARALRARLRPRASLWAKPLPSLGGAWRSLRARGRGRRRPSGAERGRAIGAGGGGGAGAGLAAGGGGASQTFIERRSAGTGWEPGGTGRLSASRAVPFPSPSPLDTPGMTAPARGCPPLAWAAAEMLRGR